MSGNGIDIGAVHQLVLTLAAGMQEMRLELRQEMREIRQELAQKADKDDVALLRQAVTEYHSAVVGHGILISEMDDRLRRVEQHLGFNASS